MNEQIIAYLKDQGLNDEQIKEFLRLASNPSNFQVVEVQQGIWEKEPEIKDFIEKARVLKDGCFHLSDFQNCSSFWN